MPWGRIAQPFVFSALTDPLGPAPVSIGAYAATPTEGANGTSLRVSVLPKEPSASISFVLPAGIVPARSNIPGVLRSGRWTATFVAPPPEGIAWEATFAGTTPQQLAALRVAVTASGVPGGTGWQRLPSWMPQDRMVWTAWTTWFWIPRFRRLLSPCLHYVKLRNRYGEGRNVRCATCGRATCGATW